MKVAYAQLPIENYFKIDKDYDVILATSFEFHKVNVDSVKLYEKLQKNS
jgi:hypothetical protein